jgi:folate-binding protein YgfZ
LNPINISTSGAFLPWQPAAWLRISGADAATFLQGQFTNDLRGLQAGGGAVYGLWLTVKGKVLADSFVLRGRGADEFWVGSYFSPAATIRERLEAYVIADEVEIEDETAGWAGLSLIDGAALEAPGGEGFDVFVFRGRRARGGSVEWVARQEAMPEMRKRLAGRVEWDAARAEARRIADGVPVVPRDVGPADLPNEAGMEAEAVSFTKGCYLGQEVMARLKTMGQVRRRLVRVAVEAEEQPAAPCPLFAGAREVGELRSVAPAPEGGGYDGLAMVSRLHVTGEARLSRRADGAADVRVVEAP